MYEGVWEGKVCEMMLSQKKLQVLFICVFAAALCAALAGCGGSATSGSAAASSGSSADAQASASSESVPADPSEKFLGDWSIAAMQMNEALIVGDLSALGEDGANNMKMTVEEDGTGELFFAGESGDFTWELADDNTLKVTPKATDGDGLEGASKDGTIDFVFKDDLISATTESDGQTNTMIFSRDGVYQGKKAITAADGTPITSEDALVGSWKFAGAGMQGMCVYGDEEALGSMGMNGLDVTIEQDGTAKLGEDELASWSIGEDGAVLEGDFMGASATMPLLSYEDYLIIDLSAAWGSDMLFLFTK